MDNNNKAITNSRAAINNVSKVEFITRDQAMENFKKDYKNSSLFEGIDSSVFRDRYVVYLKDISLMSETQAQLQKITGVDSVSAQLEISKGMVTFLLAGRTFIADTAAWNARAKGHIEATEKR